MQLLEAIESISRQRSVETVELALLQTLGQHFAEVEEAMLLLEQDGRLWVSSYWQEGKLHFSDRLESLNDPRLQTVARESLTQGQAHEGNCQGWRLATVDPPNQLLLLRCAPLTDAGQRALRSLITIVENFSRLLSEKNRDRLTGLLNRHQLEERVLHALSQASLTLADKNHRHDGQAPNWLAILDIDHFKRINDGYGHLFGDEVLLLVSRLMTESFRREDQLFRYGGEEFVLILGNLPEREAELALERFRQKVSEHKFPQLQQLTLSIGYTRIAAQGSASAVLGEADRALYWTKENGRNRSAEFTKLIEGGLLDAARPMEDGGSIDLF